MLEARSVALVGATPRAGSLGMRALVELERSPASPVLHLVNPTRAGEKIEGYKVLGSLEEIEGPVDLVVFALGDEHLEGAVALAAARGDRAGVIFGSVVDAPRPGERTLRDRVAKIATDAGMALCGGGCMGFVSKDVRAIGYIEPSPLPRGPVVLVSHSGSVFSALLRADRPFGWTLAVSSGQELVTTCAQYLEYALELEETGLVLLVLETPREVDRLEGALLRATERGVPVVALAVGASEAGRSMVAAHSGALAGSDAAWDALFERCGVVRVGDLGELCDTAELLVSPRRPPRAGLGAGAQKGTGIAAVLDSGAERALVVDVAAACAVPFATIGEATIERLEATLDPGLEATNPLDVWGRGHSTEELFTESLLALADDEHVRAVALAVDLVVELDADPSYPNAVLAAARKSTVPMCVLSHVPSAIDRDLARSLRAQGIPVLEGTRSGLLSLRHLLELEDRWALAKEPVAPVDEERRARWLDRLRSATPLAPHEQLALLFDYGIATPPTRAVGSRSACATAGEELGYPVVLKTAAAGIAHKTEAGGVFLELATEEALLAAYDDLSARLGPDALVAPMAEPGVELTLGVVRDPVVGPLVVLGAGGTLVELLSDRSVALAPFGRGRAEDMVARLRVGQLLHGWRGSPAADMEGVLGALESMSALAAELGHAISAMEVNPLRCSAHGALALDVLLEA